MTELENTTSTDVQSPDLESSAVETPQMSMDDFAASLLQDTFPDQFAEESQDVEVSAEETEYVDDSTEEETAVEEDSSETKEEDMLEAEGEESTGPLTQVDYEEIKNFAIPVKINGEIQHLSIDQINSEVNRARSSGKEVEEAKLQKQELDARSATLDEQERLQKENAQLSNQKQQLATLEAHLQTLHVRREEARQKGDQNTWTQIGMQMEPLVAQYQGAQQEIKSSSDKIYQDNIAHQMDVLQKKGYGEVISDKQRLTALTTYLKESYSPSTIEAINQNAELLILAEEARQAKASKGAAKKGKIKGNGKVTMRSGDGKGKQTVTAQKKAAQTRALRAGQASETDYEAARQALAMDLLS